MTVGVDRAVPPGAGAPAVLADPSRLRSIVRRLAAEVARDHPHGLVAVAVLKGSLPFLADLVRQLHVPVEVDFLAISHYAPDSGRVRVVKDLDLDVSGRPVVLVEDIVDTGLTLAFLLGELRRRGPSSVSVCALADKAARRILPVELRYVGLEVPDVFVLGYGLDFSGRYRNLDRLVAGEAAVLSVDPDAYVPFLYGTPAVSPPPSQD